MFKAVAEVDIGVQDDIRFATTWISTPVNYTNLEINWKLAAFNKI